MAMMSTPATLFKSGWQSTTNLAVNASTRDGASTILAVRQTVERSVVAADVRLPSEADGAIDLNVVHLQSVGGSLSLRNRRNAGLPDSASAAFIASQAGCRRPESRSWTVHT